jgi:uncharacterized protein (DUF305 family)
MANHQARFGRVLRMRQAEVVTPGDEIVAAQREEIAQMEDLLSRH